MNLFYLLVDESAVCSTLIPIMTLLGYLIFGIKVVVPIILIIVGMTDLAKAIVGKDDSEIKKAQMSLVKKIVVAVCVYLVITLVGLIMSLIYPSWSDSCADAVSCALSNPFDTGTCYVVQEPSGSSGSTNGVGSIGSIGNIGGISSGSSEFEFGTPYW